MLVEVKGVAVVSRQDVALLVFREVDDAGVGVVPSNYLDSLGHSAR